MSHINFNKLGNYKAHILCLVKTSYGIFGSRYYCGCEIQISDLIYNGGGQDHFGFDIVSKLELVLDSILDPSVTDGVYIEFKNDILSEFYDNYSEKFEELGDHSSASIEFDIYFDVF